MALKRYGMLLKKYLKELNPMKYSRLTIDGSLMDFLYDEEKYLYKYADMVRLFLKHQHPEPKTHEFIVMAQYNNMIDNKDKRKNSIEKKEEKNMAVSMAVIPTLKGKAASSVLKTISTSKIKPYSQTTKADTEKMLSEILEKRDKK